MWAVNDAGSLTGLVGDLGRGLWNPVCGGEAGILVFGADPCAAVVGGRLAGFAVRFVDGNDPLSSFLSPLLSLFSGVFVDASLVFGLFGVVGVLGTGDFFGEGLAEVLVFAVDIGEGLVAVFVAAGFSRVLEVVGFDVPFVCPFDVCPFVAFFSSAFANFFSFHSFPFTASIGFFASTSGVAAGVKIANSGIVSSIMVLCFLADISVARDCFLSAATCGCVSSSILKLVLRFVMLGSPLVSLLNPKPNCPLLSTVTNDVRTTRGVSRCFVG